MSSPSPTAGPWYREVTRYQWFVLFVCSLAWIFDAFEGQLFVATMNEAIPSLVAPGTTQATIDLYNNVALALFLVGGAAGGVIFGMLSDRIGRTRTLALSIITYSMFTGLTALAQTWWQIAALRFIVALGVAGAWGVGAAMVAEVFPQQARAWSLAIFSASSVFAVYLAAAVGAVIVADPRLGWRWAFASGVLPALLAIWAVRSLKEPAQWAQAREAARLNPAQTLGNFGELFRPPWLRRAVVGLTLSAIGLGTYWGVHIYGRELYRRTVQREFLALLDPGLGKEAQDAALSAQAPAIKRAEMLGMFLASSGAGLGLLAFGPISDRLGRRGAHLFFFGGALLIALLLFQGLGATPRYVLWVALPVFGFFTVGMNSGASVYYPELFPTRIRATGIGFCFNGGRLLSASTLVATALLGSRLQMPLEDVVSLFSLLYLVGAVVLIWAPETLGKELPT